MKTSPMVCKWKSTAVRHVFFKSCCDTNIFCPYSCLAHVVNLVNVDIMSHITKIAAVETSTAIWEYDPSLPDNRVLGGSLDVIAAIWTLAIKVHSLLLMLSSCHPALLLRFKPPVNVLRYSTSYKLKVGSRNPSRYLYTAMYDGVQHSSCLTGPTNFVRSCSSCFSSVLLLANSPPAYQPFHLYCWPAVWPHYHNSP